MGLAVDGPGARLRVCAGCAGPRGRRMDDLRVGVARGALAGRRGAYRAHRTVGCQRRHYPPTCADGLPCGVAHSPGDDAYCLRCTHEPKGGDTVVRDFFDAEMVKQARYQDSRGGDWIDECARTFTPEEFRGAMRFTVGKYLRRLGKKDAELQEVRKMRDYCQRWEAYLVAKEDDQ